MKPHLIDKAFLLKKTTLFGTLDLDLLLTIADRLELLSHREGEKVFEEGQEAHHMYLIVEGKISAQSPVEKSGSDLSVGEFFGDEGLFSGLPRAYAATCVTSVVLLSLSRSHLLSVIAECPSVALAFLEAYARTTPKRH